MKEDEKRGKEDYGDNINKIIDNNKKKIWTEKYQWNNIYR